MADTDNLTSDQMEFLKEEVLEPQDELDQWVTEFEKAGGMKGIAALLAKKVCFHAAGTFPPLKGIMSLAGRQGMGLEEVAASWHICQTS